MLLEIENRIYHAAVDISSYRGDTKARCHERAEALIWLLREIPSINNITRVDGYVGTSEHSWAEFTYDNKHIYIDPFPPDQYRLPLLSIRGYHGTAAMYNVAPEMWKHSVKPLDYSKAMKIAMDIIND